MRLLERTLKTVYIAPGLVVTDALGCVKRDFSEERISVRAGIISGEGTVNSREPGLTADRKITLLMPLDAPIARGDGVSETALGAPEWLCTDVTEWSAHLSVALERKSWP